MTATQEVIRLLGIVVWVIAASVPGGARSAIQVTDDLGRSVTLPSPASRVVSLAPHATELLYAVGAGDSIIGAVSHSDYPPAARAIPRVGGYDAVDTERILALKPDLVVGWASGNGDTTIERLERIGLTVYASEPRSLDQIARNLRRLGELTGHAGAGADRAAAFRGRVRQLATHYRSLSPVSVFYEVWPRPLMTVNGDQLISRVIRLCGGRNVFGDLGPLVPTVSTEAVLAANPEAIVASGRDGGRPTWLDDWRQWHDLTASVRGNLFHIHPDLLSRATPRLLDGAATLCRQLQTARTRRPNSP